MVGALVIVVIAITITAVLSGRSPKGSALPPEGPRGGAPAPSFSLTGLRHPTTLVSLGKPNGRPTVVSFFASWCPNCHKDVGVLAKARRQLAASVNFVGVDVADSRSAGVALVRSAGMTYPVGFDPNRRVASEYQLVGFPSTVFLNGSGQVVGHVLGAITQLELTSWLRRAAS